MLIPNIRKEELLIELGDRYYTLSTILKGRPARETDKNHGLKSGKSYYSMESLARSSIIEESKLRLALADFKSILTEIGRPR